MPRHNKPKIPLLDCHRCRRRLTAKTLAIADSPQIV
jgi:hypothetical protein